MPAAKSTPSLFTTTTTISTSLSHASGHRTATSKACTTLWTVSATRAHYSIMSHKVTKDFFNHLHYIILTFVFLLSCLPLKRSHRESVLPTHKLDMMVHVQIIYETNKHTRSCTYTPWHNFNNRLRLSRRYC